MITNRIREKVINSFACAAICGLSISFVIGESIDAHRNVLTEWHSDPGLAPEVLPVAVPYKALAKLFNANDWKTDLVAVNSREPDILAAPNTRLAQETPLLYRASSLPKTVKLAPVVVAREDQEEKNIHQMLLDVHEAEAEVVEKVPSHPVHKAAVISSNMQVAQAAPVVAKTKIRDTLAMKAAAPEQEFSGVYQIHGRLLPVGSNALGGHFEVGLYDKVDAAGMPVGFPISQQILAAGETDYALKTTKQKTYLFARYTSDDANNEERWFAPSANPVDASYAGDIQADIKFGQGLALATQTPVAAVAAVSSEHAQVTIRGRVGTMFAHQGQFLPQAGAIVKLRGAKNSATTNARGDFELSLPAYDGQALFEVVKPGFMPTIIRVGAQEIHDGVYVDLASKDAIDQMAQSLGLRQSMAKSVFIGQAQTITGPSLEGMTVQLGLHANGPYYFSHEGYPAANNAQHSTSSDGRFIYFNVDSGVGYLEASTQGEPVTPLAISTVDGGGLIYKKLVPIDTKLRGRVLNPVAIKNGAKNIQIISGAHVKFAGSSEWANTDAYGYFELNNIKVFRGEDLALEMSAEKFYNHRYILNAGNALPDSLNLYAFPATYINGLANAVDVPLDPYMGLILGGVGQHSLRIDALAENADTNNAKDFYFDKQGALQGSYAQTDKNYGTYVIFNVPTGRVLLHGMDSAGNMQYSGVTYTSASTVNVILK